MKNLTIYCKDFELSNPIHKHVSEKMGHLLKYIGAPEGTVSFNVRLGKVAKNHNKGDIYYSEVSIHTPEKNYGGRIESSDIYTSVDLLKDELAGNICNKKAKRRTLNRHEGQKFKQQLQDVEVSSSV